MLLAIDIGNTNIVAGAFAGDTLVAHWRLRTDSNRTRDEYALDLTGLFRLAGADIHQVSGAVICSVVPSVQATLCNAICRYIHVEPMLVTPDLDLELEVRYKPRRAVGADRVANAVAAIDRYGVPAVVVDFGTATTFDAISSDRAYIGGAIAPGLEIAEEALYSHTAQLPRAPLVPPAEAIGTTTSESLQSGLLFGYAGLVDGLVNRFCHSLGDSAHVIATGGLAELVAPHTRTVQHVDPDLTLYGLHLLYERHASRRRP